MRVLIGFVTVLALWWSTGQPSLATEAPPTVEQQIQELREKLADLEAVLTDPEGTVKTTEANVKKVQKVAWSGYLQSRFESVQGSSSRFFVRRARLKLTAKPTSDVQAVVSADFGQGKVETKDAFVLWLPGHSPELGPTLALGQQNWCFGREVPVSSSVRECPERSLWAQKLFKGERDLGLKVTTATGRPLFVEVGVFNGTGINTSDNNDAKDVVSRVGFAVNPRVDVGASGYWGSTLVPAAGTTPARTFVKNRFGADVSVVLLDGVTLKGEWVTARELGRRPDGWQAQLSCNVGKRLVLVGRFDSYDDDGLSAAGRVDTWAVGFIRYLDSNLRAKVFFESPKESGASVKNDAVRCELLASF